MDFSLIDLVATVLAAWRITSAINREKIGSYIRVKFAKERTDMYGIISTADTFVANMIVCFMCLSFWVSVLCVAVLLVYPLFLYPFAISTLVIYLDKVE